MKKTGFSLFSQEIPAKPVPLTSFMRVPPTFTSQ